MKSIINKYLAYDSEYGGEIERKAYLFGQEIAQKAIDDDVNPYEVSQIVFDGIMNAFAVARVKHGVKIRKEEMSK